VRPKPGKFVRNWPGKQHAALADMLATLKADSLAETKKNILSTPRFH